MHLILEIQHLIYHLGNIFSFVLMLLNVSCVAVGLGLCLLSLVMWTLS